MKRLLAQFGIGLALSAIAAITGLWNHLPHQTGDRALANAVYTTFDCDVSSASNKYEVELWSYYQTNKANGFGIKCLVPGRIEEDYEVKGSPDSSGKCSDGAVAVVDKGGFQCYKMLVTPTVVNSRPTIPAELKSADCDRLSGQAKNYCTAALAFSTAAPSSANASEGCPKTATPGHKLDCTNGRNPIYALLQFVINWVIRLLAVLAVIAIIISGIQYIASQGNPDGIKAAKSRLTNAIIGLILLSLMFVILRLIGVRV
jgi:hypothetical protein